MKEVWNFRCDPPQKYKGNMKKTFREIVGEALGRASVAWSETPKGVFDSDTCLKLLEEILKAQDEEIRLLKQKCYDMEMALGPEYEWSYDGGVRQKIRENKGPHVTQVTLCFPDGITPKTAQEIAIKAEEITMCGISQGGFMCLTPANLYFGDGPVEWNEGHMEFIHGYNRNTAR